MRFVSVKFFVLLLGAAVSLTGTCANARELRPLYHFAGGADGDASVDKLLLDGAGNLYGVTIANDTVAGTVFKLAPDGTETILHAFQVNAQQSSAPFGGVVMDGQGNLYGNAEAGGAFNCPEISRVTLDCGSVYKLAPDGTMTTIYSFQGGTDGSGPSGGLLIDNAGNLFGTTKFGGSAGVGTVFEIASNGTKTVLYNFAGQSDGARPTGSLIADGQGNLYGTTTLGGLGQGTVFKLAANGTESVLYAFGGSDGSQPSSGLSIDAAGNLYGTTPTGGGGGGSYGEVFKLTTGGVLTILHSFTNANGDGVYPNGGMAMDGKGNLAGSTRAGGKGCRSFGCGTVFRIGKDGTYSQIATLDGTVAHNPLGGLVADTAGNVYGSALDQFKHTDHLGILFEAPRR